MRILILLMLSMVSYAAPTDFSECKGKEANYYVAKFTKNGNAKGWLKAAKMHQNFYKERGSDILVVPMLQYKRDSEGNVTDEVHRITSMVIGTQDSWKEWREMRENLSETDAAKAQKEYDAYVSLYNKHTELTVQRKLCIL
tara:strand:- start:902 stop:1324 length:423 start_codon:yes stop_codon:yes gene_type:complete